MTIVTEHSRLVRIGVVALCALAAACSNPSKTLGLDPDPPDEFQVVSKAPLTIPPDFNLRPPQPGAPRPQVLDPTSRAQAALVGEARQAGTGSASAGESALLQVARADRANPEIRQVLTQETTQLQDRDKGFVERLVERVRGPSEPDARVVDATEEERRLRQQQASANVSAADQETPVIRRKSRSILSDVF
jgi:hypothetical protein